MNAAESAVLDPMVGWIILGAFSALWVVLGWYWGHKDKELDEYVLAGRKLGLGLGAVTVMANWVTSNTTLLAPQLVYQLGLWGVLGYSLGAVGLLLFAPMATRIHKLMPAGYTAGDFVRLRYGKTAWRVFLVISLSYGFAWMVSMGMAGGILINALTGIPYIYGVSVVLWLAISYTFLGGFRADVGTDYIQAMLIIFGLSVTAVLAIGNVGIEEIHTAVAQERPRLLDLMMPAAIMFLFNNLLFGMGEIFHSNVWWSRSFAFREGVGFKAFLIAGLIWAPTPIVAGFIGLAAPALNLNVPSADMIGPMISAEILGVTGAVLVLVVVFAALCSSMDSLVHATSMVVTEDIYHRHLHPNASSAHLRRVTSVVILGLGVLTWALCVPRISNLAAVLNFAGAFVASTIWPIAAGLYWRSTNPTGATVAMLAGSALGLIGYYVIGWYVAALFGAAVSMLIVLITTWTWPRRFDWHELNEAESARGESA